MTMQQMDSELVVAEEWHGNVIVRVKEIQSGYMPEIELRNRQVFVRLPYRHLEDALIAAREMMRAHK
jgi:hypothetical protein